SLIEYNVRWKGLSNASNTWIAGKQFNCYESLTEFKSEPELLIDCDAFTHPNDDIINSDSKHMNTFHENGRVKIAGEKKCKINGKIFASPSACSRHVRIHTEYSVQEQQPHCCISLSDKQQTTNQDLTNTNSTSQATTVITSQNQSISMIKHKGRYKEMPYIRGGTSKYPRRYKTSLRTKVATPADLISLRIIFGPLFKFDKMDFVHSKIEANNTRAEQFN
ncbi:hypothetical protein Bhyg_15831, partial [Pseudolycoriella hygida]